MYELSRLYIIIYIFRYSGIQVRKWSSIAITQSRENRFPSVVFQSTSAETIYKAVSQVIILLRINTQAVAESKPSPSTFTHTIVTSALHNRVRRTSFRTAQVTTERISTGNPY